MDTTSQILKCTSDKKHIDMLEKISDDMLDEVAGGITSSELEELATPLFKNGLGVFDVYTELVNNDHIHEDEEIWDSDLSIPVYLNDMMDQYMYLHRS